MSTDVLHRITHLAVRQFAQVLCKNRDYSWGAKAGIPPSKAYIEQKPFSCDFMTNGPVLAAWQIENYECTTRIEPLARFSSRTIDGMFFDWLIGNWGIAADLKTLSIHWQTGPRFGRGFSYQILEAPTGVLYLGSCKELWVS